MKKRMFFAAALLIVLAVGILLWLRLRREALKPEYNSAISETTKSARQSPAASPVGQTSPTTQPVAQKLSAEEQRYATITAWEQAREREIEFWGKVIDQHDEAVAGVAVTATITTYQIPPPGFKPQPTTIYSASTDTNGVFYIKGRPGRGFTIETMKKEGYVLPPALQSRTDNLFLYNYDQLDPKGFKADRGFPVEFRMWKLEKPEKLVEQRVRTAIPYDGKPITYDLLTGHETQSGGDFRVTLMRNPQQIRWGQRNYEWTITFEAIDGGLIETSDRFTYLAPETGYNSKITIHMAADAQQWRDEETVSFFLKSIDGKHFGRVEVTYMVGSDQKETGFKYHSFVNANGSRNLEYDPTAQLQSLPKSRLNSPVNAPAAKP